MKSRFLMPPENFARLLFLSLLTVAAYYSAWYERDYSNWGKVREVDPGRIYAGSYHPLNALEQVLEKYRAQSVLSLRCVADQGEREEEEFLAARGIASHRIAMHLEETNSHVAALLDEAVGYLIGKQNQPVFVHCFAGMHRTGLVIAAYRVTHCGWTEEQSLAELREHADKSRDTDWACAAFRAYCQGLPNRDGFRLPLSGPCAHFDETAPRLLSGPGNQARLAPTKRVPGWQ